MILNADNLWSSTVSTILKLAIPPLAGIVFGGAVTAATLFFTSEASKEAPAQLNVDVAHIEQLEQLEAAIHALNSNLVLMTQLFSERNSGFNSGNNQQLTTEQAIDALFDEIDEELENADQEASEPAPTTSDTLE